MTTAAMTVADDDAQNGNHGSHFTDLEEPWFPFSPAVNPQIDPACGRTNGYDCNSRCGGRNRND